MTDKHNMPRFIFIVDVYKAYFSIRTRVSRSSVDNASPAIIYRRFEIFPGNIYSADSGVAVGRDFGGSVNRGASDLQSLQDPTAVQATTKENELLH